MSDDQDEAEWTCAQCGGTASTDRSKPDVGSICFHCARRLRRWLLDIPDLFAQLDARPGSAGPPLVPAKRRKLSGSPALARLDVILLQDPRTTTSAYYGTYDQDDPEGTYKAGDPKPAREAEDKHDPEGAVQGTFLSYANRLAKECGLRDPDGKPWRPTTLSQAIETLTGTWWENVCYAEWITDLYQDASETWRTLRRTNGIIGPRKLGQCQCGRTIFEPTPVRDDTRGPESPVIECKCGHRMSWLALARLEAAQRMRGTA
jgi:hypothetical protein